MRVRVIYCVSRLPKIDKLKCKNNLKKLVFFAKKVYNDFDAKRFRIRHFNIFGNARYFRIYRLTTKIIFYAVFIV